MEKERLDKCMAALNRMSVAPERYRITNYSEEEVYQFLKACYQKTVASRAKAYIETESTNEAIEKATKWLTGNHKAGLLLYGGVGNGKSTLSLAICKLIDLLEGNNWNSCISSVTALELANIAMNDKDRFNNIKIATKLVIDDLGTEPSTVKNWGNEISPVTEILYHRYDNLLFTVVTSNLNDKEIKERYGIRIADRISEMFDKVFFSGESYRKK